MERKDRPQTQQLDALARDYYTGLLSGDLTSTGYSAITLQEYLTREGGVNGTDINPKLLQYVDPQTPLTHVLGIHTNTTFNIFDGSTLAAINYYGLDQKEPRRIDIDRIGDEMTEAGKPLREEDLTRIFPTLADYKRFGALEGKATQVWDELQGLSERLEQRRDSTDIERYGRDRIVVQMLQAASKYVIYKTHEDERRLIRRLGHEDELQRYFDLSQYNFPNTIVTRIGGIRLVDVMENGGKSVTPDQTLRFFVEAQLLSKGKHPQETIDQNKDNPRNEFPATSTHYVRMAPSEINAFCVLKAEDIDRCVVPLTSQTREMKQTAKQILERVEQGLGTVQQLLLYPEREEFASVKNVLEGYFNENEIARKVALHFAVVGSTDYMKQLYRFARRQVDSNSEYAAFYKSLLDPIRQVAEEAPNSIGLLTSDDIPVFLDETVREASTVPFPQDLEKITLSMSQKTKERSFTVDPNDFELDGLVHPRGITLHINHNQPRRFTMQFHYESKTGESETINVGFDTKHYSDGFEWSFIEDPTDIPEMHDAILTSTGNILTKLDKQLEEERLRKLSQKVSALVPSKQIVPVKKGQPIPIEPEVKAKVKTRGVATQTIDSSVIEDTQTGTIKNNIEVTDSEAFQKRLQRLSSEDQGNVQEALQEYNQRGVGRFYRMKALGKEGELLYILRTKSSVRGGIRVLVTETGQAEGVRSFKVVDVGYRKDIYRDY